MIVTTIISLVSTSFVTLTGNDHESVFWLIDSCIKFFDRELIRPNAYIGSSPNYQPVLNFHISRFKDIMTILHYERPLAISMDPNTLKRSVTANAYEPVGEQEP